MTKPTILQMQHAVVHDVRGITHAAKCLSAMFGTYADGWILVAMCRASCTSSVYMKGTPNCLYCVTGTKYVYG